MESLPLMQSLPHSLEAQEAVLSTLLFGGTRETLDAVPWLRVEHFFGDVHLRIFEAIRALDARDAPFDAVSVAAELETQGRLKQVGGRLALGRLSEAFSYQGEKAFLANANVIYNRWRLRALISAATQAIGESRVASTGEEQQILEKLEEAIGTIAHAAGSVHWRQLGEVVNQEMDRLNHIGQQIQQAQQAGLPPLPSHTGIKTGLTDIDKQTGGINPGEVIVVAARTSMGKTAFVLNVMLNIAHRGEGVALFSLEMTAEQNALRLLSTESKESLEVFRKDGIAAHQWQPLVDAQARLNSVPFFIDDTPAITTLEIRGRLRNLQRERSRKKLSPIVVVGVDYLQLVKGTGYNREQEVASVTRTLKEIARTEKVCILAVSQLNRAVETQKDKRPSLKDLRESGAIEQDADGVWFIYREGYYNKGCANPNEAEIGIAKQRNGPTGTVKVRWNSSCVKFENAADVYDDLMPAEDPNPKYEYYDQIDDL